MAYSSANMDGESPDTENDSSIKELPLWEQVDRPRGILTKKDRELLLHGRDIEGQDLRNARYRIRQRVIASLHDIVALSIYMDSDEFSQITDHREYPFDMEKNLIGLAYKLLLYNSDENSPIETLEESIVTSIKDIESDRLDEEAHPNRVAVPSADIELKFRDLNLDSLQNKILSGDASVEEALYFTSHTEPDGNRTHARQIAIKMVADYIGVEYEPDDE